MQTEGGRDPRNGEPIGADRDLGVGQGQKSGGRWTRETATTCTRNGTPGSGRDLGSRTRTTREVSAGTSGRGWRVGETSRWKDAPRPGELGRRSRCNRENGAAFNGDRWGGGRS